MDDARLFKGGVKNSNISYTAETNGFLVVLGNQQTASGYYEDKIIVDGVTVNSVMTISSGYRDTMTAFIPKGSTYSVSIAGTRTPTITFYPPKGSSS